MEATNSFSSDDPLGRIYVLRTRGIDELRESVLRDFRQARTHFTLMPSTDEELKEEAERVVRELVEKYG